jgi:hypothetical protein
MGTAARIGTAAEGGGAPASVAADRRMMIGHQQSRLRYAWFARRSMCYIEIHDLPEATLPNATPLMRSTESAR